MITKKEAIVISNLIQRINSARRISEDFKADKEAGRVKLQDTSAVDCLEWQYWIQSLELELKLLTEFGISEHYSEKAAQRKAELKTLIKSGQTYLRHASYEEAA